MLKRIEQCAARVVSLLRERRSLNILLLPDMLEERSVVAYQALGWLARGGDISYSTNARQVYISLRREAEQGGGTGISLDRAP